MSRFIGDCSRCCGLCCIVPAYLKEQGFPGNKPAERPCRYLEPCARCAIHAERVALGYGACAGFDCHGAGQRVTAQFGGARWQDSPGLRQAMAAAYRYWLPRYESAALLDAALPLVEPRHRSMLEERIDSLLAAKTESGQHSNSAAVLKRETLALIRSLLKCD